MKMSKLMPNQIKMFLIILCLCLLIYSCLPFLQYERSRAFFSDSTDNLYQLSDDIENDIFNKYTINDTKFVVIAGHYIYHADRDDIKKDLAGGKFSVKFFSKPKTPVVYRILKVTVSTSSFTMEVNTIDTNGMPKNEVVFDPSETAIRKDGYLVETILGDYFVFPRPKDMKYTITMFLEEEKENGEKSFHKFEYFYKLKMIDHWFRLLL